MEADRFGWAYVENDLAFSLVPWNSTAPLGGNPLLFVDESYDERECVTLYAGLLMTPGAAFSLAGWYLGNLVTLRKQVAAFWPADAPPPRLHFRELFNESARRNTTWQALPDHAICNLVGLIADAIGQNEHVHPFIVTISDKELRKALAGAFPGGVNADAVPDLIGQIVATALATAVADNTRPGLAIDLVIDYNATRAHVGVIRETENELDIGGRRQATLRFMEVLRSTPTDPGLVVDLAARASSKFPHGFTWASVSARGYAFKEILEPIGLQFADLYVNAWRHFHHGAYPQLQISRRIMARARLTEYFWAPEGDRGTEFDGGAARLP